MPGRTAPLKCRKCAALDILQVHQLHGSAQTDPKNFQPDSNIERDGCYDPKVCPSKRSYLRNNNRTNQKRTRQRQEKALEQLQIEVDQPYADVTFAVLIVYRAVGVEAPIHAISGSVWRGSEQIVDIAPIHCVGMVPTGVHAYIQKMLKVLHEKYGIHKFASLERLDPQCCPIRPCIHSPEVRMSRN
jgi:hypothetical protein